MNERSKQIREMVIIDAEKLDAEIKKRGLERQVISIEMGMNTGYLSSCMNPKSWQDGKTKISKTVALLLKSMYNIDRSSYEYTEPVVEEKPVEEVVENPDLIKNMTGEQLSNLIYKAVYSAVKHAWEDDNE